MLLKEGTGNGGLGTSHDSKYRPRYYDPPLYTFDWKWLRVLQTLDIPDKKRRPEGVRYNESWL